MARAVLEVNVMPILNSSSNIKTSYNQKLQPDMSATH